MMGGPHMMRWNLMLLVLWMTAFADAASNSLTSTLDEGNGMSRSACLGEEVTYTCTVVDMTGIGTTFWEGSAFNCPGDNNRTTLLHFDFGNSGGTSGQCGALAAQSQPVDGNCYTSVLTVPGSAVTEALNGTTIECSISGVTSVGSDSMTVAPFPAPEVETTELSPECVTVEAVDYPRESLHCIRNFTVEESDGTTAFYSSDNGLTVDICGLNLCSNMYAFEVFVVGDTESSPRTQISFASNLTTLETVSNVQSDNSSAVLQWDAPDNAPVNCIGNYQIEVDDFSPFETPDNSTILLTSVLVQQLGLQTCERYLMTIAPRTSVTGPVQQSASEPFTLIPMQGFPSPEVVNISSNVYTEEGVKVNLTWENASELSEVHNAYILADCGNDMICTPVNLSDFSSSTVLTLNYSSSIGEDVQFSVTFMNPNCQRNATATESFSNILRSAYTQDVTLNSVDVLIVYNTTIATADGFVVQATLYLQGDSSNQVGQQMTDFPSDFVSEGRIMFSFTDLEGDTDYRLEVRIVSGDAVIGRAVPATFTTLASLRPTPGIDPEAAVAIGVVAGVGGVVLLIIVFSTVAYILYKGKKKKAQKVEASTPRGSTDSPDFASKKRVEADGPRVATDSTDFASKKKAYLYVVVAVVMVVVGLIALGIEAFAIASAAMSDLSVEVLVSSNIGSLFLGIVIGILLYTCRDGVSFLALCPVSSDHEEPRMHNNPAYEHYAPRRQ